MINCSNCGSGIADDQEFCGQCGAPRPTMQEAAIEETVEGVPEEPVPVPEAPAQEQDIERAPSEPYMPPPVYQAPQQPKKSSNTCLWIVLGCLILFLILVCVIIVVLFVSMAAFTDTINQLFQTINLNTLS